MGCDGPLAATAADSRYFNPRIPYGMRPLEMFSRSRTCNFNPRIPYGMRLGRNSDYSWTDAFQSTHPVWDATCRTFGLELFSWHFNPRIPYGMRRGVSGVSSPLNGFQSTHPVWDATIFFVDIPPFVQFQSTHPVWDATLVSRRAQISSFNFNPRIPYGMRLREWTLHSIIWKLLPALRADYIADIPEHLSVCIFGL